VVLSFSFSLAAVHVSAVERVEPGRSGDDLVLTWGSESGQVFYLFHRASFETNTNWFVLVTNLPAASGTNVTSFTHTNALADCPPEEGGGEGMMLLGGGGKLLAVETDEKGQKKLVRQRLEFEGYKFPELPWEEKAQEEIALTYPGLLPERPWGKVEQEEIVQWHQAALAFVAVLDEWLKAWGESSSGGAALMSFEEGEGEGGSGNEGLCNPTGYYLVVEGAEDLDGDGLPDWWEYLHFGRLGSWGGGDDPDDDGLTNREEYALALDPRVDQSSQPGSRRNYGYDALARLKALSGVNQGRFGYDKEGNVETVAP
jgi:hypothetical protein